MLEEQGLQIVPGEEQAMSKSQKLFNSRIKKINQWKAKIQKIKDKVEVIRGQFAKELAPLESKINEARFQLVLIFAKAYDSKTFKAKDKAKLNELILSVGGDLVHHFHNEELKAIFKKHQAIYDELAEKEQAGLSEEEKAMMEKEQKQMEDFSKDMLKQMIKEMTGMDIEIDDLEDMDHIEQQVREQQAKMESEAEKAFKKGKKGKKKKDKGQEQKMKDQAAEISKTSRKIYAELIKLLHPDRSKDDIERAWKTEAIKEVTEAYQKNDFFALLQLQLKYLEQAKTSLSNLSEKQLEYYNQLLLDQMKDLEDQFYKMTQYGPQAEFYQEYVKSKKRTKQAIDFEKSQKEYALYDIESDVRSLSNEKRLKRFLRDYRPQSASMFDDFFTF